ncbi:hypothetical protein FRC01_006461 [Tulasnella sp. 417]|nr:hypothetical protein FRC01_006461 [Tulasnella sp. 417]
MEPPPSQPERQKASAARGDMSDPDEVASILSQTSSVDRVLLEHFSGSESILNYSSVWGADSSSSERSNRRFSWISAVRRALNRHLVKRRVRILMVKFIAADELEDGPAVARQRRYEAATGLVEIVENEPGGEEIVVRKFSKKGSAREKRALALLKLGDDDLDRSRDQAVNPVFTSTAFAKLMDLVTKHTNEKWILRKAFSTLWKNPADGMAAIHYLATAEPRSFFSRVDCGLLFSACKVHICTRRALSSRWLGYREQLQPHLFDILNPLIWNLTVKYRSRTSPRFKARLATNDSPDLLIAACCDIIDKTWVRPQGVGLRKLNTEGALGVSVLVSLFKVPAVVKRFSALELPRVVTLLMDIVLHPWTLEIRHAEAFEKTILKPLTTKEDLCLKCISSLPGSEFSGALSRALNEGIGRLDSPTGNPYEPLGLVERLLWLSNTRKRAGKIHLALVDGGACEFLAHALNYSGNLNPDDRGLWRAKGLAMTCLGNIIERMNKEQFCNCMKEEMIASVVAIKKNAAAPLVQKGQAIFLLQRYTVAADHLGVQPFHREDTSNMAEEFRNPEPYDSGSL